MLHRLGYKFLFALVASCLTLFCATANVSAQKSGDEKISVSKKSAKKINVAHRGASAYAPEHTLAAYRLAITQKADFVEQDLQITKDGVLVCLHDETLERTTNVEQVFPTGFTLEQSDGASVKRWYVADFTLAEIKRLDAGTWFNAKFVGERVPTFAEAIQVVVEAKSEIGLYPETKAPEVYGRRGFDMERLLIAELKRFKLDNAEAKTKSRPPVIIQSFSAASLQKLRHELKTALPLVLLISGEMQAEWLTPTGLKRARTFAIGIAPAKNLVTRQLVERAHAEGLSVTPYTFRSTQVVGFTDVRAEMKRYLYEFGVDALFTDNPDVFPRQRE